MSTSVTDRRAAQSRALLSFPRWLLIVGLLLFGSLLGTWVGHRKIVDGFDNAYLRVDPGSLDFGEVWEQKAFRWTLPVKNSGSEPIIVERFATSCGCASVEPSHTTIPAGETQEVRLTLDLTSARPRSGDASSYPFSVTVAPVVKEGLPQYRGWQVKGVARRPFTTTPTVVDFGDALVAGEPFSAQTFEASCDSGIIYYEARCEDPDLASAEIEPIDGREDRFRVRVIPAPGTAPGHHQFNVLLSGADDQGSDVWPVEVPVYMTINENIQFTPSQVNFGALEMDAAAEETVAVRSRIDKPFQIISAAASADSGINVEVGGSETDSPVLRIRQRALAAKNQDSFVEVIVRYADDPDTQKHQLPVVYYGHDERNKAAK